MHPSFGLISAESGHAVGTITVVTCAFSSKLMMLAKSLSPPAPLPTSSSSEQFFKLTVINARFS